MNTVISHNCFIVGRFETFCPFDGVTTCLASLSSMEIDNEKRISCCGTDNFDNCPLFLSKVLRGWTTSQLIRKGVGYYVT